MLITRFHDTETLQVSVEFLTPTFLGGADQNAELRAAPFKNLLRQWWRVAVGSQYPNHKEMLKAEGDLFGSVLDESKASASRVRLDLQDTGINIVSEKLDSLGKTKHPEVTNPFSNLTAPAARFLDPAIPAARPRSHPQPC